MQQHQSPNQKATALRKPKPIESANQATSAPISTAEGLNQLSSQDILMLQRQIGNAGTIRLLNQNRGVVPQSQGNVQRLPQNLSGTMQTLFGETANRVEIRTDSEANQIARQANAEATTIDNVIYFDADSYQPGTAEGNALIAREMAHMEHARMTGETRSSSQASPVQRRDADNVSGIVQAMGANPHQTLNVIGHQPTRTQQRLIQRVGGADTEGKYSHSRSAGIVASKIAQGVFTTLLGPVSLVWRWPLIQKNMGEALGDDIGTFKGKEDDKLRYGGGKLGDALRFMAIYTEILKELLIWCGFASLITAIVAGATHGALTPVFVGIAIVTAIIGGVLAALKGTMVGLNWYRLIKAKNIQGKDGEKKRAHIKAQMVNDGMDGIGALLSTIFASLGAGGVGATAGGAIAKDIGYTDGTAKLVGAFANMGTQGIATSSLTNAAKESGKEAAKPGKEHGFFGGESGKNKDGKEEAGGFFKDALVIKDAYKPTRVGKAFSKMGKGIKSIFSSKKSGGDDDAPMPTTSNPDTKLVIDQISFVADKANERQGEQKQDQKDANKASDIIIGESSSAIKNANDAKGIQGNLADTANKGQSVDVESMVDIKDETEAETQEQKINQALGEVGEGKIEATTEKKPGFFSRVGNWFKSKLGGLKRGARRLMNWIMKGVLKFVGKFSKSDADPSSVAVAMNEEKTNVSDTLQTEQTNTENLAEFKNKAIQSKQGILTLAEQENE